MRLTFANFPSRNKSPLLPGGGARVHDALRDAPEHAAGRLALLRHMHDFELVDRLEHDEACALLDTLGQMAA